MAKLFVQSLVFLVFPKSAAMLQSSSILKQIYIVRNVIRFAETNPRYTWQVANSPALGSIPLQREDNLEYFSSLKLHIISIKLLNRSFLGPSFFGYLENHHQC